MPPWILYVQARNNLLQFDCRPHPAPASANHLGRQVVRVRVGHADVKKAASIVLKVRRVLLEARVDELEHFEPYAIAGGHVCNLDFVQGLAIDGEDRSRGCLGSLYMLNLASNDLETKNFCVPLGDSVNIRYRDGNMVDWARVLRCQLWARGDSGLLTDMSSTIFSLKTRFITHART